MHEQSLAATLLKQVDAIRRRHNADAVAEVRIEVGPLSGVEPLLLHQAFRQQVAGGPAADAALRIDEVPLAARCGACDREHLIHDFVFRCPACQGNLQVVRGDRLLLISVSLQRAESPEPAALPSEVSRLQLPQNKADGAPQTVREPLR